jgi:hypothetical protein
MHASSGKINNLTPSTLTKKQEAKTEQKKTAMPIRNILFSRCELFLTALMCLVSMYLAVSI